MFKLLQKCGFTASSVHTALLVVLPMALLSLHTAQARTVTEQALITPGEEWLSYGRDYTEQRFSPLDEINVSNVKDLDLAWSVDFESARGMEATPILHNGVLYVTTGWSHVYAIDAQTGQQLWHFDPQVPKSHLSKTCCGPVNRGVAIWQGEGDELLVFVAALDGRLIAINAANGELRWSTQTTPTDGNYSITGAPRVINGMVVIGNGGAELGVRGFVSAYDSQTGEQIWRFYTVPGDPNKPQENAALTKALDTWTGEYWYQNGGGGGTAWDSLVYDPELDLLYIGTGNGSPWNRDLRSPDGGDNLYLSSIVALRPDTGEYVWHYQVTPKENWDYTATQQLVLADIEVAGKPRKVIMQAPKNGFFYVLDRQTGELLSADAFTNITWATHIDLQTGRPVESKYADYQSYGDTLIWPAPTGAHNWQPMSYSPETGLMYIPVQNGPAVYSAQKDAPYGIARWNTGIDLSANRDPKSWVAAKASIDALVYGELIAWDPLKKKRVWAVKSPDPANGGVLATAGNLVFQGQRDGSFRAHNAQTGETLWQYYSDSAILAGPISYRLNGEQYVAVAQGSGGAAVLSHGRHLKQDVQNKNRLLVFKLGDSPRTTQPIESSVATVIELGHQANSSSEAIERGNRLYGQNCSFCHGISAKDNGVIPDLRYMSETTHSQFVAIVFGGVRSAQGMPGFHASLSVDNVEDIHAYLDHQQQVLPDSLDLSFTQKIEYWLVYWGAKLGEQFPALANATRGWML